MCTRHAAHDGHTIDLRRQDIHGLAQLLVLGRGLMGQFPDGFVTRFNGQLGLQLSHRRL